ncbi:MAG TPA: sigma-70 family RNA polymerase sigma factor [Bacteriovoracaceae bacterium]|nr:sigma-70 family RNA polymerase sigma factor [Bacteriovoracaceae bacterium]
MQSKLNPLESSRQEIIINFMPTIRYWAKHFHYQYHQVLEFEDLVTVGVIGLIDAMNKYKHEKKNQFKTYAEFRIRGEIIDELRKQDWMTRSERTKQKKYKKTKSTLTEELGRAPTTIEMSNVLPFKPKDITRLEQYECGDSIKQYVEGETVEQNNLQSTEFEIYALKKTLSVILDDLPRTMRLVVTLKYFEDLNFYDISRIVNLSEGRICQLHAEALELLKEKLDNDKIDILAA